MWVGRLSKKGDFVFLFDRSVKRLVFFLTHPHFPIKMPLTLTFLDGTNYTLAKSKWRYFGIVVNMLDDCFVAEQNGNGHGITIPILWPTVTSHDIDKIIALIDCPMTVIKMNNTLLFRMIRIADYLDVQDVLPLISGRIQDIVCGRRVHSVFENNVDVLILALHFGDASNWRHDGLLWAFKSFPAFAEEVKLIKPLGVAIRDKTYKIKEIVDCDGGNLWLVHHFIFPEYNRSACNCAAENGYLKVLKWLYQKNPSTKCSSDAYCYAARYGHLEVLQWMRTQDSQKSWLSAMCTNAASGGHLEILKWLRAQDPPCEWNETTYRAAEERGHIDVLKWLRAQDPPCPWSNCACRRVAHNGHLNVLG